MPNVSKPQVIGHQAEMAVQELLSRVDVLSERIGRDYGEDILVQPHFNGELDNARLWIQVKGTDQPLRRNSSGALMPTSVTVTRGHLARWVGTADFVVLVRWHVSHAAGWYKVIQQSFDESDLWGKNPKKEVRIKFDPDDRFDEGVAKAITWKARLHSAAARISKFRIEQAVTEWTDHDAQAFERVDAAVMHVATRTMTELGMLHKSPKGFELRRELLCSLVQLVGRLEDVESIERDEQVWDTVVAATALNFMRNFSDGELYLPHALLPEVFNITKAMFHHTGVTPATIVATVNLILSAQGRDHTV